MSNQISSLQKALIGGAFILITGIVTSSLWLNKLFPRYFPKSDKTELSQPENNDKKVQEKDNQSILSSLLTITNIELSPRKFEIPSYFYFKVAYSGNKVVKDLNITIDLGKSNYESFDYSKRLQLTVEEDSTDKSYIKIFIPKMRKNETIEFYSLLTDASFENILLNAKNMTYDKVYTYEQYLDSLKGSPSEINGFETFLIVILGIVIVVLTGFFLVSLIAYFVKRWNYLW